MKVWYHLIAALVGFAVAALIVYLVFGSASEQGAVQDGDAGSLAAGTSLCGSVDVADTTSADTRAKAAESPPALFDTKGPIAEISEKFPKQRDWVARVHAAGGLCLDELTIENSTPASGPATNVVKISMSTTEDVDDAEAGAYAGGVLAQAFTPPFSPRSVTIQASVGDTQRTVVVTSRAWRAFNARRQQIKPPRPATMANLKLFQQASAFGPADLKLTGW